MKIPKVFPKIPGSKILENPGIEILDPVKRPDPKYTFYRVFFLTGPTLKITSMEKS